MASNLIPALGLSKLGIGAKLAARAGKVGDKLGYIPNLKAIQSGTDKFAAWSVMSASEAMFEADNMKKTVVQSLEAARREGLNNYTDEQIAQVASERARDVFASNMALLAATNAVELGMFFKNNPSKITRGVEGVADDGTKFIPKETTRWQKIKNNPYVATTGTLATQAFTEGFIEENLQYTIEELNTMDYKLDPTYSRGWGAAIGELFGVGLLTSAQATLRGDEERMKNVALGALIGGGQVAAAEAAYKMGLSQSSPSQQRAEQNSNPQQVANTLNDAVAAFSKFDIYETEEVTRTDAEGNEYTEQIPIATPHGPVIDEAKLASFVKSQAIMGELQHQLDLEQNKEKQDEVKLQLIRDKMIGELAKNAFATKSTELLIGRLESYKELDEETLNNLGFILPGDVTSATKQIDDAIAHIKYLERVHNAVNKLTFDRRTVGDSKAEGERAEYLFNLGNTIATLEKWETNVKNSGPYLNLSEEQKDAATKVNELNKAYDRQLKESLNFSRKISEAKTELGKEKLEKQKAEAQKKANKLYKELREAQNVLNNIKEGLLPKETTLDNLASDLQNNFINSAAITALKSKQLASSIEDLKQEWVKYSDSMSGLEAFKTDSPQNKLNKTFELIMPDIVKDNLSFEDYKNYEEQAVEHFTTKIQVVMEEAKG